MTRLDGARADPPRRSVASNAETPAGATVGTTADDQVFAGGSAMALDSGRVIEGRRGDIRDLERILEAVLVDTGPLSTGNVMRNIAERLSRLTDSPNVAIYAVEDGAMRVVSSYHEGRFDEHRAGTAIPLHRYPCCLQAVETAQCVVVSSLDDPLLEQDRRSSLEKWGYQAQLSLPLVAHGHVSGILQLSDRSPHDYGQQLPLIRGLGQIAAHALASAVLAEQVERHSIILNELVDLGSLAGRSDDLTGLLRRMAERLLVAVDAAGCDIYEATDGGLSCAACYDRSGFDDGKRGRMLDPEAYPTLVAAARAHHELMIEGPDDPQLTPAEQAIYRQHGFGSEVCIPLVVNERLYGLIDLYDTRKRDYTEYLGFLRSVGQALAGALESSILFGEIEQRTTALREIVDLGAITSQTHDLQEVLRTIAGRLRATIQAADCDIFALQGEQLRCLVSAGADGFDEEVVGNLLDIERYPATATAVQTGEPMIIADLDDPRLTKHERENYAQYGYQSELCIPLVAGDRVMGLIDIFDTRPRDYAAVIDYLRSVGQMAAGAIENALLVEELERRNAALAEIVELGRTLASSDDLDALVRSAGPRIVDLVGATGCQLFTLQEGRLHCLLTYENGVFEDDYVGHPLDLDLFPSTQAALADREPLVIPSPDDERLSEYERALWAEAGSGSEISLPLVVEDRLVGLLDVYDTRERDYDEYRDFLVSAAQTLAGVFENALLVEQLEQTNEMLNLLVESGVEFGATLELQPVLESVARRLCAATDAPNCDIYTIEGDDFRCVACLERGVSDDDYLGTVYSLGELPLVAEAIRTQRPIMVTDIAADARLTEAEREKDMRWGHRAKLELPLVSRGEVVGVAGVFDDRPRAFEHLDLLVSLAQVAANALANATLFGRLDRSAARMTLVSDVSYELSSSLDLAEVLRSTALRLCAVADVPECDIYTLQDDTLVNVVSLDDGRIDRDWQGRTFPLAGWAALQHAVDTRLPVSIETLDDPLLLPDERALMEAYGETCMLAVPLISKERVIGVLQLLDRRGERRFSAAEIETVSAVCRVAALAIDNADLVADLQLRNHENELLNEIASVTSASLDLPAIAAAAMDKLRRIVPFDDGFVALRRDDGAFDLAYVSGTRAPMPDKLDATVLDDLLTRMRDERVIALDLPDDVPNGLWPSGAQELRAGTLIALAKGEDLVGVLALGSSSPRAFAAVDRRLLERTGTHLALAVDNARMYRDIKLLHLSNLKALSSALNAKDYYTLGHAARVAAYMVLLGQELGWPLDLLRQVEEAAYLHDIGKIGVSDRVLLKPSRLNAREWELMRQHPIFSADIIRSLFPEDLVLGVRHHHERYEGGGYPDGIAGEDIPAIARAMCVVDSYDAMSFRRPYRQGLSARDCVEELRRCRGTQFDPVMVDAFVPVLDRLAAGRRQAQHVAREAARRVDPDEHARLRSAEDEASPEYRRILDSFRDVCAANPPARFITSHVRHGKKTVVVVDSGEEGPGKPHIGDEILADDDLVEVFAGHDVDANVLFVDQWGVWISGTAPVVDRDGRIVAAVTADLPATEGISGLEDLNSNVAQTFASMLQTAALQAGRSEVEAITDGLTGLYNHRYFHERLNEEMERCLDQGGHLSLLLCDLDNFRAFNELHGHSAGDQALKSVAGVIDRSIRHVDIAARFGGEEFAAILIGTDERGALEVAERIRAGIVDAPVATAGLSISIGVASCPADAMFKEELIDKADWAMYLAKRRGRDQVMSFSAHHGSDTPEQAATVTPSYVAAMSDLVAARDAYERRRRYAVAHLAQAVGAALGLDPDDLRAMAAAAETDVPRGVTGRARAIIDAAATYERMVAERPYREQLSETEALDELLDTPALRDDVPLAQAFLRVLSGDMATR